MAVIHNVDWNTVGLAVVALLNALTAFLSNRNNGAIRKLHGDLLETKESVIETKENIAIVERATNSMKDALVQTTAEASAAKGELKGRADAREEALKDRT